MVRCCRHATFVHHVGLVFNLDFPHDFWKSDFGLQNQITDSLGPKMNPIKHPKVTFQIPKLPANLSRNNNPTTKGGRGYGRNRRAADWVSYVTFERGSESSVGMFGLLKRH